MEVAVELAAYRDEFPITKQYAFLNHAGSSPLNRRTARAVQQYLERAQTVPLAPPDVIPMMVQLRERAACLINAARPDEIANVPNTGTGINIAANSLPLRAGDNVLVLDGDYPANIYPWLNLAPRGVLTKWLPQRNGGLDLEVLEARVDRRTRVIALSSAMFATGFRNDLAAVGALCKRRNIFFVVDAIQTLGAFPLDVGECQIDFLACGANKWLLATPGAGILYCRHDLLEDLQLGAYVGAASTVDFFNFLDYNFTLQPSSDRFNIGVPNFLGMVALNASLELLQEAGIERVAERILSLNATLIADLQSRGFRILSSLEPEHRSGIIIVEVPDPQAACDKLRAVNVSVSVRGGGLRVAPHFYNSEEDVLRVGEALA
jgi:selenocysteine lyase/cysteine desulfurase